MSRTKNTGKLKNMENRARKRTRVADYNYDDGVAERSAKRIKKDHKVEQEPKKEKHIKQESTTGVKKESKIAIKAEVKPNIKTELKKEKTEKASFLFILIQIQHYQFIF